MPVGVSHRLLRSSYRVDGLYEYTRRYGAKVKITREGAHLEHEHITLDTHRSSIQFMR